MEKEIICTICPTGCIIKVVGDKEKVTSITGYTCKRGLAYGESEFLAPVRTLTSTVKVENGSSILVACRSNNPLPKGLIMDCMKEIHKVTVKAPIKRGDVIIPNILNTGVDIIASGDCK